MLVCGVLLLFVCLCAVLCCFLVFDLLFRVRLFVVFIVLDGLLFVFCWYMCLVFVLCKVFF